MRKIIVISIVLWALLTVTPVYAHASLVRSTPTANATLEAAPQEIRLWFTEALEPDFSTIKLRNADGDILETPPAQVQNAFELVLVPGELPDGIYTVSWKVISQTDGHLTQGSFSFAVGNADLNAVFSAENEPKIPFDSAAIRWLNLLSMALLMGSVGFILFVWQPSNTPPPNPLPITMERERVKADNHIRLLIALGWLFLGLTTGLILLLQVSIITEVSVIKAISSPSLKSIITDTYFGELWRIRVGLWFVLGVVLAYAERNNRAYWLALFVGAGILWTQSRFSHASSAQDQDAAVVADWLHLLGMALWLGGLIQFLNVMLIFRAGDGQRTARHPEEKLFALSLTPAPTQANAGDELSTLIAHFSNYARLNVIFLILTGIYATWLHVGNLEALTQTDYGQALLIKLILFLPLLGIAGINLIFTQRGLQNGQMIWQGRLRRLLGVEIGLIVGIVLAVGVMTAISPAKDALQNPKPQAPTPIVDQHFKNPLNAELTIGSGWAGENTFSLKLTDREGNPIEDASLIRLRFENQTETVGESELNPTHQGEGVYTVTGANLSVPGEWRIRATVQRPNTYDTVIDFSADITSTPTPAAPPPIDTSFSDESRLTALLLLGMGLLAVGGYAFGQKQTRVMAVPALLAAVVFGIAAATLISKEESRAAAIFEPADPVRIAPDNELPMLITADGTLLQPNAEGTWEKVEFESPIRDAYRDSGDILWAATDTGLYFYQGETWQQFENLPTTRLADTHGYLFALGLGEIIRTSSGKIDQEHVFLLNVPDLENDADEIVMLGNHSHVLQNGENVFLSADLGLGWRALDAPGPVDYISTDADGNLLASTSTGIWRWNWNGGLWENLMPLPDESTVTTMQMFGDTLYVVAGGKLYLKMGNKWEAIELPDSQNAYITHLAFQYPDTLWVLDSEGNRLWSSVDGENWIEFPINP